MGHRYLRSSVPARSQTCIGVPSRCVRYRHALCLFSSWGSWKESVAIRDLPSCAPSLMLLERYAVLEYRVSHLPNAIQRSPRRSCIMTVMHRASAYSRRIHAHKIRGFVSAVVEPPPEPACSNGRAWGTDWSFAYGFSTTRSAACFRLLFSNR